MTATVRRPAGGHPAPPGPASVARLRAMLTLARIEGVRLLRHPLTAAGALIYIGLWCYGWFVEGAGRYPVLPDEHGDPQFFIMLLLGGAALVAGNLAVLRPHRHGTTAGYEVLLLGLGWRTGAHLLALFPLGALAGALVALRCAVAAASPTAAGRPDPYELAAGPVAVLLLGAVGVLLGRLFTSLIAAPLVLLCLAMLTFAFALPLTPGGPGVRWLMPIALSVEPMPLPTELMARPAAAHLGYLVGMLLLAVVAALAGAGVRGPVAVLAGVAALAGTVGAAVVQARPASDAVLAARGAATAHPGEQQICRRVEQVTYCAFADFLPWVDGWHEVVSGVLRRVPAGAAQQPLAVRQRVWALTGPPDSQPASARQRAERAEAWRRADRAAGTPNAVTVGTRWGDGRSEMQFAGLVAYEVLTRAGAGADGPVCGARGVLLGWLAGQASPRAAAGLRDWVATGSGGVGFLDPALESGVWVPDREMAVVRELLRRPAAEVAAVVVRSWDQLSAPGTGTQRAGELFTVAVPPAAAVGGAPCPV